MLHIVVCRSPPRRIDYDVTSACYVVSNSMSLCPGYHAGGGGGRQTTVLPPSSPHTGEHQQLFVTTHVDVHRSPPRHIDTDAIPAVTHLAEAQTMCRSPPRRLSNDATGVLLVHRSPPRRIDTDVVSAVTHLAEVQTMA
jgi:hypothetical protein